jgi:uncharacterized protein
MTHNSNCMAFGDIPPDVISTIIPDGTIFLAYRGSIAHNMYIPQTDPLSIDDKDLMGVCIPSIAHYFGLKKFEQLEKKYNEWDSVVYELRKFLLLLSKQNPNVLELLWLQPQHYISMHPIGQMLLDHKELFQSKQAYHTFLGYAKSQLHKMNHHTFQGYMGEKRKKLVKQFGYDTKHAAHLIRLLRMGTEYLTHGQLNVFRHDAFVLLEIKQGKWSLKNVHQEANNLIKELLVAYKHSPLPDKVNDEHINELCVDMCTQYFFPNK